MELQKQISDLIEKLEDELMHTSVEWDKLDSQGNQTTRQGEIKRQMLQLEKSVNDLQKLLKIMKGE